MIDNVFTADWAVRVFHQSAADAASREYWRQSIQFFGNIAVCTTWFLGTKLFWNPKSKDRDLVDAFFLRFNTPVDFAKEEGAFSIIPAALVFRVDGIVVTRHVAVKHVIELRAGERIPIRLEFGPLLLGDGRYLLSLGLYRKLDLNDIEPSEFYDYFDKSFEFQVVGNPRLHNELVRHPATWRVGDHVVEAALELHAGKAAES